MVRVGLRAMRARYSANSGVAGSAHQIRRQLRGFRGLVLERNRLGVRLQEEIERIEHRHLGDQVDLDPKLARCVPGNTSRAR